MNALDIWHECRRRAVALSLNGDRLHYDGTPEAIEPMLSAMKAHRDKLLVCVIALDGALLADGPYWPWGPYLSGDEVRRMRANLVGAIAEIARLECWQQAHRDEVLTAATRGPLSALLSDLHHFTGRLMAARTEAAARDAVAQRAWKYDRRLR